MNESYLQHYGVKGMKWGVRRARKRAAKENVQGRGKFSTGKNYDKVYSEMKKEKAALNKRYAPKYQKLVDDTVAYNNKALAGVRDAKTRNELAARNRKINSDYYKESMKLARSYADRFNRATLQDIGYENVDKGMEYLKKRKKDIFDVEL